MPDYHFFVYIMSSETRTLYIGVTNSIRRRVWEHKNKVKDGFTKEYGCTRLVYCEQFQYVANAIAREKQLKGLRRVRKLDLVSTHNPLWKDLAEDWYVDDEAP